MQNSGSESPAPVNAAPGSIVRSLRWSLLVLVILHSLLYAYFVPEIWQFILTGAMGAGPQLIILLGQLGLLGGALMLATNKARGRNFRLAGMLLLGLGSLLTWREPFFILPWLYRAGFVLALLACLLAPRKSPSLPATPDHTAT